MRTYNALADFARKFGGWVKRCAATPPYTGRTPGVVPRLVKQRSKPACAHTARKSAKPGPGFRGSFVRLSPRFNDVCCLAAAFVIAGVRSSRDDVYGIAFLLACCLPRVLFDLVLGVTELDAVCAQPERVFPFAATIILRRFQFCSEHLSCYSVTGFNVSSREYTAACRYTETGGALRTRTSC